MEHQKWFLTFLAIIDNSYMTLFTFLAQFLRWIFRFVTQFITSWSIDIRWTASRAFGTYSLCELRRFRRACASAQSHQNLRCSLIQAVSQEEHSDRKPDSWPLWMGQGWRNAQRHKFAWHGPNDSSACKHAGRTYRDLSILFASSDIIVVLCCSRTEQNNCSCISNCYKHSCAMPVSKWICVQMTKFMFKSCHKKRLRSVCAFLQSGQHLHRLLPRNRMLFEHCFYLKNSQITPLIIYMTLPNISRDYGSHEH